MSGAADAPVVWTHVYCSNVLLALLQRGAPSGNPTRGMSSSSNVDIKYDFQPFNGTPGETYDKWERALLNNGARADDRGYSISDHLNGTDEGSANVPHPAAAGSADGRKSRAAQRKRQKDAYAMLTRHLHAPDHLKHIPKLIPRVVKGRQCFVKDAASVVQNCVPRWAATGVAKCRKISELGYPKIPEGTPKQAKTQRNESLKHKKKQEKDDQNKRKL